ncbi:MAG: zinc-binding alcohol dehydrogenase family protein [Nostoc sp.]|uniref:quinone oxidoreductase family protein n=1 Tax=Nostoc sp. TaxID=1180 RepID=UPI002FF9D083
MRNFAICGSRFSELKNAEDLIEGITLENILVYCGLVHTQKPDFVADSPSHRDKVLVRKRAFSCNYRDKSLILKMATRGPDPSFYVVGSEFVGEVVAVGADVKDLCIGDRVIGDNHYPGTKIVEVAPGIPSNQGSKEYQIFHPVKLMQIPAKMPDEVAAAFGLGAQTSYSILRRLKIVNGDRILVTAARSNTSLFVIQALQQYDVRIYATTTSHEFIPKLEQMGVETAVLIDPTLENWQDDPILSAIALRVGGFSAVVDPFFDLHLGRVISLMAADARYITCGFHNQYSQFTGKPFEYCGQPFGAVLTAVMLNNLHIMGNCLGQSDDLKAAIQDYVSGKFKPIIDTVFSGDQIGVFLNRTYNASDRFGKVVYSYQ